MNIPRIMLASVALALCVLRAPALELHSFTVNQVVPDGQPAGFSDVETISSSISQIGSLQVSLDIVGNFNGDLYCYLQHGSALSVLLNRAGRTAGNAFGYDDSGFNITLSDTAVNGNIHTYRNIITPPASTLLTGAWQPDGRLVNPASVLDTDPVTARLNLFNGMNANGAWTLFVSDMSAGGANLLSSWQLIIQPVPEPSVFALLGISAGAAAVLKRRLRK